MRRDRAATNEAVLGVDAYGRGWVGVRLRARRPPEVVIDSELKSLLERFASADVVAIDMPIGLPKTVRECDLVAKRLVAARRNSVFMTPPKAVLDAPTYENANRLALEKLGHKISRQAYALAPNIRLVAKLAGRDHRIIEVHPEVSFFAMVGRELDWPKTSWNGQAVRRKALARVGINLANDLGAAGAAPPADVLDAAAAAWSARRYMRGEAESCPPGAKRGRRQVIWY